MLAAQSVVFAFPFHYFTSSPGWQPRAPRAQNVRRKGVFPMTRTFHVADLTPGGETRAVEPYEYVLLERVGGASDLITLFSSWLWRAPDAFEVILPDGRMRVRWRASSETSGIASLRETTEHGASWSGQPGEAVTPDAQLASIALLLTGKDPAADTITVEALQQHLVRELHDTGFEPAFGLRSLDQRPLIATISLRPPDDPRQRLWFALWDRCFAASYFRKQGLA